MTLKDTSFNGARVIVRVDFNVPMNEKYEITDLTRIKRALPTLLKIQENGGRLVLLSHLGRPQKKLLENGQVDKSKFSLEYIISDLEKLTKCKVLFEKNVLGAKGVQKSLALNDNEILLLENTRFSPQETKNGLEYASRLAAYGDYYVNDAFGTSHRAHASNVGVAKFFPKHRKMLGLLMEEEITNADKVIYSPRRPVVAIVGGAKVSDKIQLLNRLIEKVDFLIIGGGMAYTFIKAADGNIGNSLCEEGFLELAKEIVKKSKNNNVAIILPVDSLTTTKFSNDAPVHIQDSDKIDDDKMGLDAGPKAIADFKEVIEKSKTILWNGPLGVFEFEHFSNGTFSIAKIIADQTKKGSFSLIGGGDSVAAINQSGLASDVSFISTGGGAMLEYLEGKELPGIACIKN